MHDDRLEPDLSDETQPPPLPDDGDFRPIQDGGSLPIDGEPRPLEDESVPIEEAEQTAPTRRWANLPRWASLPRRRRPRRRDAKGRAKAPWWELPVLVAVAIGVAVLLKTFVIQPFYIPSESMEKTLHGCTGCSGDRVLVNKPIYSLRSPHPGDIIVFKAPTDWDDEVRPSPPKNPIVRGVRWFGQLVGVVPPDEKDLIKRVIAKGGQTVKCCDAQGRVQVSDNGVNGPYRSLDEPYVYLQGNTQQQPFGPVTVPKGRLWVMGDNRNDSADSRYHCGAGGTNAGNNGAKCDPFESTVAIKEVIGKAVIIAWPPSRWRTLGTPGTFKHAALGAAPLVPTLLPLSGGVGVAAPIFFIRRRTRIRRRRRR